MRLNTINARCLPIALLGVASFQCSAADDETIGQFRAAQTSGEIDFCNASGLNVIIGTSNNDVLTGTPGADCIVGLGGQDTINALGGNDFVFGGDGDDTSNGGDGDDLISGGSGQDVLSGGNGADSLFGDDGDDRVFGNAGDDSVTGEQGQDRLSGGPGADSVVGGSGDDVLLGDDGNDNLNDCIDHNRFDGGSGTNTCTGDAGASTFVNCAVVAPCGFSGETGDAWESGGSSNRGLQAWVPSGQAFMYTGSGPNFGRINLATHTTTLLASAPGIGLGAWGSPALAAGAIWELRANQVLRYDIPTNTWTIVRSDLHGGDDQAMTVTAGDDGNLWSYNSSDELVKYDPVANTVTYFPGVTSFDSFETRLAYDGPTNSIYFGGWAASQLFRFDIATSSISSLAPHPEGALNDIFCSDHSGHVYAAGGFAGNTIWQYDIATNTWAQIPPLPVDHSNNGTCGVVEDGWLYIETAIGDLHRIALL